MHSQNQCLVFFTDFCEVKSKQIRLCFLFCCVFSCLHPPNCIFFFLPRLLVMRMFNLHGTEKENEDEGSSEEESDDDEEEKKPQMELAMMPHYGGINRVRVRLVSFSEQALMRGV